MLRFLLTVIGIIMNHIENISRKCCLIVSIIQSEIILVSIEISIKVLLRDSHRNGGITLKIFVPNNLRFSNKAYISIFTIGHFEVLRLYGSNCQRVQYPFWNFAHSKFSLFEMRCLNWIWLFWKFNKIRIIVRPNDRFRIQWSIQRKSSSSNYKSYSIFWRFQG